MGLPAERSRALPVTSSILLDVVRFMAAVVVFWSHLTQGRFTTGLTPAPAAGHLAVAVFFVLSGFVIRMVTQLRVGSARMFFIDRASRIYSVLLPSLLATVVLEGLASLISYNRYHDIVGPAGAPGWFFQAVPFLLNASFTSQLWGYGFNPLSNSVFWSIPYECFYYTLYGLALYGARFRWFWTVVLLLLAGPTIALFYPIWLLGCLAYDVSCRLRSSKHAVLITSSGLSVTLGALVAVRSPLLSLIRATDEPERAAWCTRFVLSHLPRIGTHLMPGGQVPWLNMASPSFFVAGVLTAVVLLFGLVLLQTYLPDAPKGLAKLIRIVADSTFTLYLVHLPALILVATCVGHPLHSRIAVFAVFGGIVAVCVPLSRLFDQFKRAIRQKMISTWAHRPVREKLAV